MTLNRDPGPVLLLGASGFLGPALKNYLGPSNCVSTHFGHPCQNSLFFDARHTRIADLISGQVRKPHAAVIMFGITNIDQCARDPAATAEVNVQGVIRIVDELRELGITPVFTSTDGVFDGSRGSWREEEAPHPILTYGLQKVEVELYIASLPPPWLIVRLPKLLSCRRNERCMLTGWVSALGREGRILCATDQYFAPAADEDVARAIALVVGERAQGIWHLGGPERVSRRELLEHVLRQYNKYAQVNAEIVDCALGDIPVLEPRPLDTSLDSSLFAARFGLRFRDMATVAAASVRDCVRVQAGDESEARG
jgi:dTDP-4-dehydrorhamnose reductase